jgi:hypothetical protein
MSVLLPEQAGTLQCPTCKETAEKRLGEVVVTLNSVMDLTPKPPLGGMRVLTRGRSKRHILTAP